MVSIYEKNSGKKSRATVPLRFAAFILQFESARDLTRSIIAKKCCHYMINFVDK
jgi:hypothetical protein